MQTHNCKDELNDVQLRATPARIALMQLLETSNKPLDVSAMIAYLHKEHIQTDPATVFRIINMFTQKGLTRQIQLHEGKARYERTTFSDHHHLVCSTCGDIQDISDCKIDLLQQEIEKKKQFEVTSHSLEFYGICHTCKKKRMKGKVL